MRHGVECKRRNQKQGETPSFDAPFQSDENDGAENDGNENTAEEDAPRPDHAIQRERNGDARRQSRDTTDLLGAASQNRIA